MKISEQKLNEIAIILANKYFDKGQEGTQIEKYKEIARLVIDRIDDNDLFEHDQEQKKYIFELQNQVLEYQENSESLQSLSESLISKLQEKLKLCDEEPNSGLRQRGLYDGYLNSLNIVIETCAKAIKHAE
jgi:hypothetical protein